MGIAGVSYFDSDLLNQIPDRCAHGAGNRGLPEQRLFLGVENSATRRAWRDRLDERAAARALATAQSTSRDTGKLYYVSHRLILQAIQEVRTEERAQQN